MKSLTQIVGIACVAAIALVLSGCATMMHTSTQAVTIRSEPPGAKVYVNDVDTGQTTPTSIRLERGEQGTTLRVEREGVRPATIKLRRSVSGWVAGNAILGPLAPGGIAADYFNGSAYKLTPEAVLVAFPDPATTPNPLTRVPQVTSSGVQPVLRDSASWFYMVAGVGGMLGRRPDADCPIPDRDSGFGASYGASLLKGKAPHFDTCSGRGRVERWELFHASSRARDSCGSWSALRPSETWVGGSGFRVRWARHGGGRALVSGRWLARHRDFHGVRHRRDTGASSAPSQGAFTIRIRDIRDG